MYGNLIQYYELNEYAKIELETHLIETKLKRKKELELQYKQLFKTPYPLHFAKTFILWYEHTTTEEQLYKMAGNSIVVNCLSEMFRKLKGVINGE